MSYIAQLKIPGGTSLPLPSGIPDALAPVANSDLSKAGNNLITFSLNWLFAFAGLVAVLFFIWGGIEWMSSRGDPAKVASAKRKIFYSIAGVVVVILAFTIVRLVASLFIGSDVSKVGL